ncbi:MAG: ATP synthase F1 subunit delta [Eubacterium sp.]|nr:ATP synthase F1 subunit delta [Eubacterium sp.]
MAKLVSKVYGDALFEIAVEDNNLDGIWNEVRVISESLSANPDFLPTLKHPDMSMEKKQELVESIFKDKLSKDVMGLLDVMIRKNRIGELPSVLKYFDERAKEKKKIGVVEVKTPAPLSDADRKKVEARVLEVTDFASLEMNYKTDKSLLGGMVIRIGDQVLDNSIRSKLDSLSRQLSGVRL